MLALIDSEAPRKEPTPPGISQPEPKAVMSSTSSPSPTAPRASVPSSAPAPVQVRARAGAGSIFLAALIGALIAGAAVLAVIRFAPERLGLTPANIADASNNGLGVLTQQIADVSGRLAELQAQVTGLPRPPADIGLVNDRITALQGDVAALKSAGAAAAAPLPGEITGLPQRLADLEVRIAELKPADLAAISARVTALEQRPAGAPGDAAALGQIKADLSAFDQRLKAAEGAAADIATLKQALAQLSAASGKSGNSAAGIVLAMDALQRLIAQGKPYAAPIAALESFAGGDPQLTAALSSPLAALKANADKGVAPLSELQATFPATADAIAHAASSVAETTCARCDLRRTRAGTAFGAGDHPSRGRERPGRRSAGASGAGRGQAQCRRCPKRGQRTFWLAGGTHCGCRRPLAGARACAVGCGSSTGFAAGCSTRGLRQIGRWRPRCPTMTFWRWLFYLVQVGVVAGIAIWIHERPGHVSFVWLGHRVDTSMGVLLAALLILLFVAILLHRLWRLVWRGPRDLARLNTERKRQQGYRALSQGMAAVAAGDAQKPSARPRSPMPC